MTDGPSTRACTSQVAVPSQASAARSASRRAKSTDCRSSTPARALRRSARRCDSRRRGARRYDGDALYCGSASARNLVNLSAPHARSFRFQQLLRYRRYARGKRKRASSPPRRTTHASQPAETSTSAASAIETCRSATRERFGRAHATRAQERCRGGIEGALRAHGSIGLTPTGAWQSTLRHRGSISPPPSKSRSFTLASGVGNAGLPIRGARRAMRRFMAGIPRSNVRATARVVGGTSVRSLSNALKLAFAPRPAPRHRQGADGDPGCLTQRHRDARATDQTNHSTCKFTQRPTASRNSYTTSRICGCRCAGRSNRRSRLAGVRSPRLLAGFDGSNVPRTAFRFHRSSAKYASGDTR